MPLSESAKPGTRRFRRILIWLFASVLCVIAAVLIGFRCYVEYHIRQLPSWEQTLLDRVFSEPVDIPPSWVEQREVSEEFRRQEGYPRERLADLTAKGISTTIPVREVADTTSTETAKGVLPDHLTLLLYKGQQDKEITWASAEQRIRETSPLLVAWADLARLPEYDAQLLMRPFSPDALNEHSQIQRTVSLLCMSSFCEAHRENWGVSFERLTDALRISRCHPGSTLIQHLVRIACELRAVEAIAAMAEDCPDAPVLEQTLDELNALDPHLHSNDLHNPILTDNLGLLRYLEESQYVDVDLTSGKPSIHYMRQVWRNNKQLFPSPGWGNTARLLAPGGLFSRITGTDKILVAIALPNTLECENRADCARATYDLVRLLIAGRVEEIRKGTRSASMDGFIPEWIPQTLNDPFRHSPFLWDATDSTFYSIGPNEVDEHNALRYNPSNGTRSTGDIAVP